MLESNPVWTDCLQNLCKNTNTSMKISKCASLVASIMLNISLISIIFASNSASTVHFSPTAKIFGKQRIGTRGLYAFDNAFFRKLPKLWSSIVLKSTYPCLLKIAIPSFTSIRLPPSRNIFCGSWCLEAESNLVVHWYTKLDIFFAWNSILFPIIWPGELKREKRKEVQIQLQWNTCSYLPHHYIRLFWV